MYIVYSMYNGQLIVDILVRLMWYLFPHTVKSGIFAMSNIWQVSKFEIFHHILEFINISIMIYSNMFGKLLLWNCPTHTHVNSWFYCTCYVYIYLYVTQYVNHRLCRFWSFYFKKELKLKKLTVYTILFMNRKYWNRESWLNIQK